MKKSIAWLLSVALLIGALSGLTITVAAAGEYLEPIAEPNGGSEWILFEDVRHTVQSGSTVVFGKELDVQLPAGYDKTSFRIHVVAELNQAAASALGSVTYVELDNLPACDTVEITFSQVAWKAGHNDFYIYCNTGSDTTSPRSYPDRKFSFSDPIRHIRMFSNVLTGGTATIDFEKVAIEMVDIDLGSDGSDTYMSLSKPLSAVPGTFEVTVRGTSTVDASKAHAVADKAITSDVAIATGDKAVFTNYKGDGNWNNVYGLYVLTTGEPALVYAGKQYTFTHCLKKDGFYKLAVAKEGNVFTLYSNGEKVQSTETVSGNVTFSDPHTIGANLGGSNLFGGVIRDIRIWEDARTEAQLKEYLAYMSITGKEEGLVAAWQMHGNITHILSTHDDLAGDNDVVYKGTRREQWIDYEVPTDEIGEDYYTMVVIPDTQNITEPKAQKHWDDITDWIAANLKTENIFHVTCLGDNGWSNQPSIWQVSQNGFSKFAYDVSWSNVVGNHDYVWSATARDTREYAKVFGLGYINNTAASSTFMGYMKDNHVASSATHTGYPEELTNTYHLLNVNGIKWMVLCLEFNPRPTTLTWAQEIIQRYSDYNVIINTHGYLDGNGNYTTRNGYTYLTAEKEAGNYTENMEEMFQKIVEPYSNVKFVLCGHEDNGKGKEAITTNNYKRTDGSVVYQMMINAQYMDTDDKVNFTYYNDRAVGMIALFRFSADGSKVAVQWYCPSDDKTYEPLPQGNEPAETFGPSWNNKSNFVLPLDGEPITADELQASNVAIEVGNTLSITFDVNDVVNKVAEQMGVAPTGMTPAAQVVLGGAEYLLTEYDTVTEGGKTVYRFHLDGLAFSMASRSAAILPVVTVGRKMVVYRGMVSNVSLLDSLYALYEKDETADMAASLINYITAVNTFNGNTGLVANRHLAEEDQVIKLSRPLINGLRKKGDVDEVRFFAMALDIANEMAFNIVLEFTYLSGIEIRVTDKDDKILDTLIPEKDDLGLFHARFSGIDIADFSSDYGFTVYSKGAPVSKTYYYSVETYVAATLRDETVNANTKDLLTALAVYADAVKKSGDVKPVTRASDKTTISLPNVYLGQTYMWGDVNGDYKVDSTDARMTLQYFVGALDEGDLILDAADVSYDDSVDSTDARLILQHFVGSLDHFPVEEYV